MPKKTAVELEKGEIDLDVLLSETFPLEKDDYGNWKAGTIRVNKQDVTFDSSFWLISEKLDGVRAYWDPVKKIFFSRNGKPYVAPKWFTDTLPDEVIDGELWQGRQKFQKTSGIVRHKTPNEEDWKTIQYRPFDVPEYNVEGVPAPFEERLKYLEKILKEKDSPYVKLVKHWVCESNEELFKDLKKYEDKGSEGLMLRKPGSLYERKRSKTLYKIKSFYDSEAKVISYEEGKGRLKGMKCGVMIVEALYEIKNNRFTLLKGCTFKVGTGFSDVQRKDPPEIGSVITYEFTEMTTSKTPIPRFARYKGLHNESNH
jgi:DNA ligase-1